MTVYDFLAVLGALAWLPPLIALVKNLLSKPELSIISHRTIEIGYTTYGPIINLNLAFTAENKTALINKIDLILISEAGETHFFSWDWFEEELLQMHTFDLGPLPFRKNQRAIAIKVPNETLIEKKIGFMEDEFRASSLELIQALNCAANRIATPEELKTQKEYDNLINLFRDSFLWKKGKYTAEINVHIAQKNTPFKHSINFSLGSSDVRNLERNIDICRSSIDNSYISKSSEHKDLWVWSYPNKLP